MSKNFPDDIELELLRKEYPTGTRIRMIHMDDIHSVPSDTLGTVEHVDDAGTIHMHWDNGSSLGLIVGEDEFEKVEGNC